MSRLSRLARIASLVLAVQPFGSTAAAPRCYPNNRFVVTDVWRSCASGTR